MKKKSQIVFGLRGEYKIEKCKADAEGNEIPGTREIVADWFSNLITDVGKDGMATLNYTAGCVVGSGNTPPANGDTALEVFVAGTGTLNGSPIRTNAASPPYNASVTLVWRFATGTAAGNLSEVGISMVGFTSSDEVFSRALITDSGGAPITITILADEILDVTYRLFVYPPTADVTGIININGVDYDYTIRACTVTSAIGPAGSGNFNLGWGAGPSLGFSRYGMGFRGSSVAYTGAIGAITSSPGGTQIGNNDGNSSNDVYNPGSYTRQITYTYDTTHGNHASGIGALTYCIGMGCFQVGFSANIMKTAVDVFAFTIEVTWDRFTP